MQALFAVASNLFTSVGTAVGVTGAGSASAGLGIISAGVSGLASMSAASYQAAVASRAAAIHEENAKRIVEAGRKEAKMQDEAAAAFIADDIAAQAASGFSLSSPSFVRRRAKQQVLADQDRANIVEDSIVQARSEREAGAAAASEGKQARRSALFSLLGTGIGMADSAISGAILTGEVAARRTRNQTLLIG